MITMLDRLAALELADRPRRSDARRLVPMAGVPNVPMAEHVVEAATRAAASVFRRDSRGAPALRAALAGHLGAEFGLDVDPARELLITHGAQHGMSVALRALLAPGAEVVIPAPTYFFDGMVRMAGARPVYVPAARRAGWATDVEAVAGAITDATRAILLCNPNNPTGHVPSADELARLVHLAAQHDLVVFSDESYARYVHDGPGYLPLQSLRERHPHLVTVTSLSKNYAFSNWRVGYVHAPAHLLQAIHRAFEWDAINVGEVPQAAALAVITGPQEWLDIIYARFRDRRDLLQTSIETAGLTAVRPAAGVFTFADLTATGMQGRALEDLLLHHGVAGIAGNAFHGPATHARLLYGGTEDSLIEVGRRLADLVAETVSSASA
ncbi:pyridoxal phosphate-dependent aminotransferase [Pseudonocardia sp. GCM10023141]|uniref:pyridoxal phosphate-dependent aminotransferase n=1 Tax=Pseudonocardia sp. GCM10023141 TaxID=3252653 RepID=UPI0036083D68